MSFQVTLEMKNLFFDRKAIIDKVERAERRNLSKAGAFVRKTARQSIRKRKRISQPGQPPSAHVKGGIKTIFFAYEPNNSSVVVGPVAFNSSSIAPQLLEHGGTTTRKRKRRQKRESGKTKVTYRKRPFMQPALEKEEPKFKDIWKDSVR